MGSRQKGVERDGRHWVGEMETVGVWIGWEGGLGN